MASDPPALLSADEVRAAVSRLTLTCLQADIRKRAPETRRDVITVLCALDAAQDTIATLRQERDHWKLSATITRVQETSRELERLRAQLAQAQAERAAHQCPQYEQHHASRLVQLRRTLVERDEARAQLAQQERVIEGYRKAKDVLAAEMARLQEERDTLAANNASLDHAVLHMTDEIATLEAQLATERETSDGLMVAIRLAQGEQERLHAQLAAQQAARECLDGVLRRWYAVVHGRPELAFSTTAWDDLEREIVAALGAPTGAGESDYVSPPPKRSFETTVQYEYIGRMEPLPYPSEAEPTGAGDVEG